MCGQPRTAILRTMPVVLEVGTAVPAVVLSTPAVVVLVADSEAV